LAKLLAENWTGLSEEAPGRSGRAERFRKRIEEIARRVGFKKFGATHRH
jgi:hypothetical protein